MQFTKVNKSKENKGRQEQRENNWKKGKQH